MGDALTEPALTEPGLAYDRLWREAVPAFERNESAVDAHLTEKSRDLRRGLTLIFRPDETVQAAIQAFQCELAAAAPGQYFYRPEELHVTVLSIIPGTEHWRDKMSHLAAYQNCVAGVIKRESQFSIHFRGVTASPGAVMVQGFPADDSLAQLRAALRAALGCAGFGGQLDVRYKIATAHVTVMRFCRAMAEGKRLLAFLAANRAMNFGEVKVARLELIFGDWYASADRIEILERYPLAG